MLVIQFFITIHQIGRKQRKITLLGEILSTPSSARDVPAASRWRAGGASQTSWRKNCVAIWQWCGFLLSVRTLSYFSESLERTKSNRKVCVVAIFFATATNQRKETFFWRASLRSKKIYLQFEEKRRGISSLEPKLNFSWVVTHLFARFINKLNDIYWLLFIIINFKIL